MLRRACLQSFSRSYLLAVSVVLLSGCEEDLRFWEFGQVAYDQGADRFRYLRVLVHIHSGADPEDKAANYDYDRERAADYGYLTDIWENRRDIVLAPQVLFSPDAFVKAGSREYQAFSLQSRSGEPKKRKSPINLDKVVVRPGRLFTTERGTLGYYHVTDVPGAAVDTLSRVVLADLRKPLTDSVNGEQLRRLGGGERLPWPNEEQTKRLFAGAVDVDDDEYAEAAPDPYLEELDENPFACLSDDSLQQLADQMAGGGIIVKRNGPKLSFRLPLSEEDSRELSRVLAVFSSEVRHTEMVSEDMRRIASAVAITRLDNRTNLDVDLVTAFSTPMSEWETIRDVDLPEEAMNSAGEMESRGVPVSANLSLAQILEDFGRSGSRTTDSLFCVTTGVTVMLAAFLAVLASRLVRSGAALCRRFSSETPQ